jgi:hypothetical protein
MNLKIRDLYRFSVKKFWKLDYEEIESKERIKSLWDNYPHWSVAAWDIQSLKVEKLIVV